MTWGRELGSWCGAVYEVDLGPFPLTDRQVEAVLTAYSLGFFEVPRAARADDVAAELGLSSGACSRRLRNFEERVMAELAPALGDAVVERVAGREEWVPPDDEGNEAAPNAALAAIAAEVGTVEAEQDERQGVAEVIEGP